MMASSRAPCQTEVKLNCPICLCDFKIPRQLPCMHSFCEKCLQDYLSSQEENLRKLKRIKCPICGDDVHISHQDQPVQFLSSQFPINVILQSILSDANEIVHHPCDSCHSASISRPAQGFCVECEEAMCAYCLEVHQKLKISRNHVIISMEEFSINPQNVMKLSEGFSCPKHDGEAIDFYCKDHSTACCGKCCIISHRNCTHVSELKNELQSLQQEKNPDNIINQMKILETHLKRFKEVNESSISLLESQVNGLIAQIRDLRKKLNDALDELERSVKIEGNRIYNEEIVIKEEKIHRSQSLINSIQNSYTLLETVKRYGTEMQVFLTAEKMMTHLESYMDQIQEKYTMMETTTVQLEVNPQIQPILSAGLHSLAKIVSTRELHSLVSGIRKPSRDCLVQKDGILEIQGNHNMRENYTGVTYLYSDHLMLADYDNSRVCLLNSSYNLVSSCQLQGSPYSICVVNDDEVAVTVPSQKTVQFLSGNNGKITPTRMVTTRYYCYSVASAGKGNIVTSGNCNQGGKHYWSLISSGGKEESCHQFNCPCSSSWTSVALDSSFRHVYITVNLAHSLYCFELSGRQKFVYCPDSLKKPRGVATDKYDNVYVVGFGSGNIHQLTPDGAVVQIISDGIPSMPNAICFSRDRDVFIITNQSDSKKLYQYRLK